jgi:hypothetical protein
MTAPRHSLREPMPDLRAVPGLHREEDRRPASRWWVAGILALGVAAVGTGIWTTQQTGEVADQAEQLPAVTQQRDTAEQDRQDLASRVVAACAAGGQAAVELESVGACSEAKAARSDPVPGTPATGARGPGPTVEQVEGAVASYMAAHPPVNGRPPTPDEVAAAVAQYMTAHPPTPGRPPTPEEISAAVALWFQANPVRDGRDGLDGATGARGPGPTDQEIDAAVAEYLAAHPPPEGKPGPACPDGSSLEPVVFADGQAGLGCVTGMAPVTDEPTVTEEPTPTTTPEDGP